MDVRDCISEIFDLMMSLEILWLQVDFWIRRSAIRVPSFFVHVLPLLRPFPYRHA